MAKTQLPAVAQSGALTKHTDTCIVLALIADAGEPAAWRFVEFFTANTTLSYTTFHVGQP
jgi:hypothetical protein